MLFLVRPEDMSLAKSDGEGMPGTVTVGTFQGAATIVPVRLDGTDALVSVHVSGSAAAHLAPGDRVSVVMDGARGVCEAGVAA